MNIETVRNALLWCTIINYGILIVWFVFFMFPHEWLYRLWGRWFRMRPEQFDALNLGGIAIFKILVIIFNLVPYIALRIVG